MLEVILLIILLCLSAFFSGSETALFSLSGFQRKKIESQRPRAGKIISTLLESPRRTLATILMGNMLVNITATSIVATFAISLFGEKGIGISIVFMTILLLVCGEVTPKTAAIRNPEGFSLSCALPLHIFGKIIWPVRRLVRFITDAILAFIISKKDSAPYITQRELRTLLTISKKEGIIGKEEEERIHSIFDLGERRVDEIMTPRVDIVGCEKSASARELVEIMKKSKYSRIPVYDHTIDRITGVIYTKDFMLHQKGSIADFIKKLLYVTEAETISNLLVKFQTEKVYIAVVLDEFGGTSGIITLKDILSEIVGEIKDEFDEEFAPIKKEADGSFTIAGNAPIREINSELALNLPTEEVNTLNGLLLLIFGHMPKEGDTIRLKGVELRVIEVKNNMIKKVQAKIV